MMIVEVTLLKRKTNMLVGGVFMYFNQRGLCQGSFR